MRRVASVCLRRKRTEESKRADAAIRIQCYYRKHICHKYIRAKLKARRDMKKIYHKAVLRSQAIYRDQATRRRARWQRIILENRFSKECKAAHKLKCCFRKYMRTMELKKAFERQILRTSSAIKIQSLIRCMQARHQIQIYKTQRVLDSRNDAARYIQLRVKKCNFFSKLQRYQEFYGPFLIKRTKAARMIQTFLRKSMLMIKARAVISHLRDVRFLDEQMLHWLAVLAQTAWRKYQAMKRRQHMMTLRYARWKQIIDTWDTHGRGAGAPFYYVRLELKIL